MPRGMQGRKRLTGHSQEGRSLQVAQKPTGDICRELGCLSCKPQVLDRHDGLGKTLHRYHGSGETGLHPHRSCGKELTTGWLREIRSVLGGVWVLSQARAVTLASEGGTPPKKPSDHL